MNYKILLLSIFTFTSLVLSAQNDLKTSKSLGSFPLHEIKLNQVLTIIGHPEISYEYLINNKNSVGLSFSYTIDQYSYLDFYILPYYRYFVNKKKDAKGFFMEGNAMYFKYKKETRYDYSDYNNLPENWLGFGTAIGYKLLNKNGLTIDFTTGFGLILNSDENYVSKYYPRFGVSIGKRFSKYKEKGITKNILNKEYLKNEFRFNIAHAIYGVPEITYERILKKSSSIGLSFSYSFTDKVNEQFFLTPHYRLYFGEQVASGFFVELGAMFWKIGEPDRDFFGFFEPNVPYGLGGEIAIGWKLTKLINFPIELVAGFGRSFLYNNDVWFDGDFVPRLGLSIGRRF